MSKDIKDYLPFYLGCEMNYATHHEPQNEIYILTVDSLKDAMEFGDIPILRPLSDMTKEEDKEFQATKVFQTATPVHIVGSMHWTAETFRWLLSKHFDLFNLISEGLAIDKTKITTDKQ